LKPLKKRLNLQQLQKSVFQLLFQDKVGEILFCNAKALSENIANDVFKDLLIAEPILKKKSLLIFVTIGLHKENGNCIPDFSFC